VRIVKILLQISLKRKNGDLGLFDVSGSYLHKCFFVFIFKKYFYLCSWKFKALDTDEYVVYEQKKQSCNLL